MFTFDFIGKLQRCNPRIYLVNQGTKFEDINLAGIWIRKPRRYRHRGTFLTKGAGRLREAAAGHIDQQLTHVPWPEVPEFEELTKDGKFIGRKGWRSVVKDCVMKKAFSWKQAKKVFGSSIGEYDWDRLQYDGKVIALQKDAKGKPWR